MKTLLPALLFCPLLLHAQPTTMVWTALGGGANGAVTAMAKGTGDSLVVVGDFSPAGGVVANHVALWNGTAFQSAPLR